MTEETARVIAETYGGAIRYSDAQHWGDSSNKLSWLIPDLAAAFPKARFVHLVRDGRKVASSYFHKLGAECYDDRSTAILQAHYDDPGRASRAAAGEEILVAAAPPRQRRCGTLPRLSPSSSASAGTGPSSTAWC